MLSGYFSYPVELEDAALIDGCTLFSVFWRIVLPIPRPASSQLRPSPFCGLGMIFSGLACYFTKDK